MDPLSRTPRTDLHVEASAPRPTPRAGVNFRELLSRSASSLVQGAQSAVTQMPGGAVLAAAVRGASGSAAGGGARGGLSPAAPGGLGPATPPPAGGPAPGNPLAPPTPAGPAKGGAGDAAGAPAEGPGAAGASPEGGGSGVENMLQTSADMNLYYLQLQEAMSTENRVYSAQSNVLKARHDTVKNAIGNIR